MTIGVKTGTNQDAKGVFLRALLLLDGNAWIGMTITSLYKKVTVQHAAPLWRDFIRRIEGKPLPD
jgi:hypothetical protein